MLKTGTYWNYGAGTERKVAVSLKGVKMSFRPLYTCNRINRVEAFAMKFGTIIKRPREKKIKRAKPRNVASFLYRVQNWSIYHR